MSKITFVSILILTCIALVFAVPRTMNYQGKLTDPSGVGINADLDMTFRIYDVATGGTALWTETHDGVNQVEIIKGLFDVELGSITPINLDFSTDYWLDVVVAGEVLMPRIKLNSTPYSFRAAIADSVAGGGSGSSNWTLSGSYLYPNSTTYDVGIGTTSPTQKLDVASNLRLRGYLYDYNNTSGTSGQVLTRGTSGVEWQDASGGVSGSGTSNYVARWTGTSTLGTGVLYDNGTDVGIGTTSPLNDLHVQTTGSASSARIGYSSAYYDNRLYFGDGSYVYIGELNLDDRLYLRGGSMSIDIAGNTGSSGQVLKSDGTTLYWADDDAGGSSYWTLSGSYLYPSSTTYDVGIGTTSPSHKLHIYGEDNALRIEGSGGIGQYGILNFGDGDYVHISEPSDDRMEIKANDIRILIGGDDGDADDVLMSDGTYSYWGTVSGGGAPGGTDGAVQYNNSGSFGGNASELYWDDLNNRLGLGTTVTTSGKLSIIHSSYTSGIWISNPGHGIEISGMGVGYDAVRALGQRYGVYATGNTNGVWGQMDANNYAFLGGTVAGNNAGMGANGEWVSGFFGDFNDSDCGERGIYSIGSIYGVFARDTCGGVTTSDNYAYLGYREATAPNTEYGILAQGNDYAGYFIGTTYFDVGIHDWQTDYSGGTGEPTLRPDAPDWGYIGTSSYNWWRMYSNQYYAEIASFGTFDTYDDLELLHSIEADTVWDPVLGHHTMQITAMPKCVTNYMDNSNRVFVSLPRMDGLLLGAIKQLDNEAKTRDRRIVERTEILAKAVGANFKTDYSQIKIFDFGSSAVLSGSRWVPFSNDFAQQLNGEIPAITLTAHSPDAGLWIAEKSPYGFLVRSKNENDAIDFDWSAFARVEVKTSGDLDDVFRTVKPDIRGSYPVHFPDAK